MEIKWSNFIAMIPSIEEIEYFDNIYKKYTAWKELARNDEANLSKIGVLVPDDGTLEVATNYQTEENYWSERHLISLRNYPYNGCGIFKYGTNGGLYLVYVELGGHAPEKRCRLAQKELIAS